MTAPIRIALMGCQGRMGKALLEAIQSNNQVVLGAALERPGSTVIGLDVGDLNGLGAMNVLVADDLEKVKDQFDVIIDFTRPEVTLKNLAFAVANNKRIVIGTTGFDDAGKAAIADAATKISVVFASNFSICLYSWIFSLKIH